MSCSSAAEVSGFGTGKSACLLQCNLGFRCNGSVLSRTGLSCINTSDRRTEFNCHKKAAKGMQYTLMVAILGTLLPQEAAVLVIQCSLSNAGPCHAHWQRSGGLGRGKLGSSGSLGTVVWVALIALSRNIPMALCAHCTHDMIDRVMISSHTQAFHSPQEKPTGQL